LPLDSDVNLSVLARRFEISGRDIKQAVLAAARAAAAREAEAGVVTMADLERAAADRLTEGKSIGFRGSACG
jgi:AAA+ superfamily predicted ATPase